MCAIPVIGTGPVDGGTSVDGGAPVAGAAALNPAAHGGTPAVGGGVPDPMTIPGGGAAATLRGMAESTHPHIKDETVLDNLEAMFEPKPFDKAADAALFKDLQDKGIVDKDGEIDFTKLGLSKRQIKRSEIEGKCWLDNNGQFHYNMSGKCGKNAVSALGGLKQAVGDFINANPDLGNKITLQINPSNVDKPSPADLNVLKRGGQIQYRPGDSYPAMVKTETGEEKEVEVRNTVKMTADPGERGYDDGFTVEVWDAAGALVRSSPKVPLAVVLGGAEYNGHRALNDDGNPILPNWRAQHLFEDAHIRKQGNETNLHDPARIQAENNLWSGIMAYLNATCKETVGKFGVGDGGDGAGAGGPGGTGGPGGPGGVAKVERDAQLNDLYGKLNAYLANPKEVTMDGLDPFIANLKALAPQPGTPEGNLLNYLNKLHQAIADPTGMSIGFTVDVGIPDAVRESLSNIHTGLINLQREIADTSKDSGHLYQAIKTANGDDTNPIGQFCPTIAVNTALAMTQNGAVYEMLQHIVNNDSGVLSEVDVINGFGLSLAQVDLAKVSNESNQVGKALLGKLTADGSSWQTMAASNDATRIAELKKQVAAFEANFPGVPVPDNIKNPKVAAAAGPTAAELQALYADLNAYLAKPKDIVDRGIRGFADRLKVLNPQKGTPEGNLLNCLGQLQQAIHDPIQGMGPVTAGIPDTVRGNLSNIRNGLAELKGKMTGGGTPIERYEDIHAANRNNADPIGKNCPTDAVYAGLANLREEAVGAMVAEIKTTDAATLSDIARINRFGSDLIRVGSDGRFVGQALLDKLIAADSPWRKMATSNDATQIAALQQQVEAFEKNFLFVHVPYDIKDAKVVAAAARGRNLAIGNFAALKAIHLDGETKVDPIPRTTAKAQLEVMLQAYLDIRAYADTQGAQGDKTKSDARKLIKAQLERELPNVDGVKVRTITQRLNEIDGSTRAGEDGTACRRILREFIDEFSS